MVDRQSDIIIRLETNLAETVAYFRALTPEDLDRRIYQEDTAWTVKLVLAHFITIEKSMQWLFNNILAGGPGSPKNFDIDRFNRTQPQKLAGRSFEELIRQLETVRAGSLSIVNDMPPEDLDRKVWHVFHAQVTLESFVRWAYDHVNIHIPDIRKRLDETES